MKRWTLIFAALAAMAGPAAAQTITAALNQDIRSSDPGVNRDGNTDMVILHVVEGLVGNSEGGEVGPLLAREGRRLAPTARPTPSPCARA